MVTITVITPSLNQARFLPRTLESIENQSFPPCEHLIYDPGSDDGSLAILREYERRNSRAHLTIGMDTGQANAINLGLSQATGDVIAWLNSDDQYYDDTVLRTINDVFEADPSIDVVYGRGDIVDPEGNFLRQVFVHPDSGRLKYLFIRSCGILQPAVFFRRSVIDRCGYLDESLNCAFDYEYWIRLAMYEAKFHFIDSPLARAVWHDQAKTSKWRGKSFEESAEACRRYYGFAPIGWLVHLAGWELTGADFVVHMADDTPAFRIERERLSTQLFREYNFLSGVGSKLSSILRWSEVPEAKPTVQKAMKVLQNNSLELLVGGHGMDEDKI